MLLASALLVAAGCSDWGDPPADVTGPAGPPAPTVFFATDIQPIFDQHCIGCHGDGGFQGLDLRTGQSYALLVGVTAQEAAIPRIDPGHPETSYLYLKITGNQTSGARMPFGEAPLPQTTTDLVRTWIEEGALDN